MKAIHFIKIAIALAGLVAGTICYLHGEDSVRGIWITCLMWNGAFLIEALQTLATSERSEP